jgi:hypothetical protein
MVAQYLIVLKYHSEAEIFYGSIYLHSPVQATSPTGTHNFAREKIWFLTIVYLLSFIMQLACEVESNDKETAFLVEQIADIFD